MKKYLILLIFLSFGLLSGCGATDHADAGHASLTLKTYKVPVGSESNLTHTLQQVFWRGKDQPGAGQAWQAGPGQILVLAPASMQDSIAKSISGLAGREGVCKRR